MHYNGLPIYKHGRDASHVNKNIISITDKSLALAIP